MGSSSTKVVQPETQSSPFAEGFLQYMSELFSSGNFNLTQGHADAEGQINQFLADIFGQRGETKPNKVQLGTNKYLTPTYNSNKTQVRSMLIQILVVSIHRSRRILVD